MNKNLHIIIRNKCTSTLFCFSNTNNINFLMFFLWNGIPCYHIYARVHIYIKRNTSTKQKYYIIIKKWWFKINKWMFTWLHEIDKKQTWDDMISWNNDGTIASFLIAYKCFSLVYSILKNNYGQGEYRLEIQTLILQLQ